MKKYKARLRTKNFSSKDVRTKLGSFPVRSIVRLGSLTETKDVFNDVDNIVEINTVESVKNSRDKLRMKKCFREAGVPQPEWFNLESSCDEDCRFEEILDSGKTILAKRILGFKGKGMLKFDNKEEYEDFRKNTNKAGYYLEVFHNYSREYRIHMTQKECIMSWRKLRKSETPKEQRWFFNSSNCNWVGEGHELFRKPNNWDNIIEDCRKAMISVGLDIGSFDVRVQSTNNNPKYVLIEVNSAPALGEKGVEVYVETINKLIEEKWQK